MRRIILSCAGLLLISVPLAVLGRDDPSPPSRAGDTAVPPHPSDAGLLGTAAANPGEPATTGSMVAAATVDSTPSSGPDTTLGTGTVVIGELRYHFDLGDLCVAHTTMHVLGTAGEGSDLFLLADFPPEGWEESATDWDLPSIVVVDERQGLSWIADAGWAESIEPGSSQIDSFERTGPRVRGTATFTQTSFETAGVGTSRPGSFEFRCPGAGEGATAGSHPEPPAPVVFGTPNNG